MSLRLLITVSLSSASFPQFPEGPMDDSDRKLYLHPLFRCFVLSLIAARYRYMP